MQSRSLFVGTALLAPMLLATQPADAQRVDADIRIGGGPVSGRGVKQHLNDHDTVDCVTRTTTISRRGGSFDPASGRIVFGGSSETSREVVRGCEGLSFTSQTTRTPSRSTTAA